MRYNWNRDPPLEQVCCSLPAETGVTPTEMEYGKKHRTNVALYEVACRMNKLLLYYLLIINLISLAVFGIDKQKARNHRWRISEKTLFLCAILGGSVGAILGMFMFRHKTKHWYFRVGLPLILLAQLCIGCFVYVSDYYHASDSVQEYLKGTREVSVTEISEGLFLDGPGEGDAMIFYPGAKVEYTAYLPILHSLAKDGIDCFLLKMPANLALLGMKKADRVLDSYDYQSWYIGGHSLGGVAASMYAASHDLNGLILLAAYPTKEIDEPTLELYGSNDGVLNLKKRDEGDQYLPDNASIAVIEGGNHAQFGDYGTQKGDGAASISKEEQWEETIQKIEEFVKK